MTHLLLDLNARYEEADTLTQCPVDEQHQVINAWRERYGEEEMKRLRVIGTALIMYPSDPTQFRAFYGADTTSDADIRCAVQALSDDRIRAISRTLQLTYINQPAELGRTWTLIIISAGAA